MQFKTMTLATTSLVALGLTVAPAFAQSMAGEERIVVTGQTRGSVNVGTSFIWQDNDNNNNSIDEEQNAIDGGATVYVPYNPNWGVMFGAAADARYANEDDGDNYGQGISLFSQIAFYDKQNNFSAFGMFGRTGSIDDESASFFAAGLGAQFFCDRWTFGGQIGYLDSGANDTGGGDNEFFHDAGFVRALVAFYVNERNKISGNFSYADGEQDSADDATLYEWGVGFEHLFSPRTPMSVYVEYRGVHTEEDLVGGSPNGDEVENHSLNLGVRVLFNSPDIKSADRTGATNNLPAAHRWVHEAGESID